MASLSDCPCLQCVSADRRLTEEFRTEEEAATRIADLSAKGILLNSCRRDQGPYRVCYRGVSSTAGILPRYEGEQIGVP